MVDVDVTISRRLGPDVDATDIVTDTVKLRTLGIQPPPRLVSKGRIQGGLEHVAERGDVVYLSYNR